MVHDGHRERLRERFLNSPESFADHELIELLLCYSISRKNTNETAHKLLNDFGSIKGIFDAGMPALLNTDGIGESSALFLRVVSEVLIRYGKCEHSRKIQLDSPQLLSSYMQSLFIGTDNEMTYLLLFDNSQKLICCQKIAEGYSCGNVISIRAVASLVISSNAAFAILVHNHPNGKTIPSGEDITSTNVLKSLISSLGVAFVDHFIVAGKQCRPILNPSKSYLYNPEEAKDAKAD